MVKMVKSILYDPLPTPAGRSGRAAMVVGFVGWVILTAAAALWFASMPLEDDAPSLATSLRVAGGWVAGLCVVCYFAGVLLAASGVTQFMNGVPDPGFKAVALGFVLIGLPMAEAFAGRAKDFTKAAEGLGLMLLIAGPNVIRLAPALIVSDAQIDEADRIMRAAADAVLATA